MSPAGQDSRRSIRKSLCSKPKTSLEFRQQAGLLCLARPAAHRAAGGRAGCDRQRRQHVGADLSVDARSELGRLLLHARAGARSRPLPGQGRLRPHPGGARRLRLGRGAEGIHRRAGRACLSRATSPATAPPARSSSCRSSRTASCWACSISTARARTGSTTRIARAASGWCDLSRSLRDFARPVNIDTYYSRTAATAETYPQAAGRAQGRAARSPARGLGCLRSRRDSAHLLELSGRRCSPGVSLPLKVRERYRITFWRRMQRPRDS